MEYASIELKSEKNSDRLKEITDRLEQGVTELFESERYKEYLYYSRAVLHCGRGR